MRVLLGWGCLESGLGSGLLGSIRGVSDLLVAGAWAWEAAEGWGVFLDAIG